MEKDNILINRLIDLSKQAYNRNINTYSNFLNLHEQNLLYSIPKTSLYTRYDLVGGYEQAERKIAVFYGAEIYETPPLDNLPISILRIQPLQLKFMDTLTHSDYLGAIMNLQIERDRTGDILVVETGAYVFVHPDLLLFLQEHLTRVKHTVVICQDQPLDVFAYEPKYEVITGTLASIRLDSLLTLTFSPSRSKIVSLIEGGKTFVNGKLITSNGYKVKEGDLISLRGFGKFLYVGEGHVSKKGRIYVTVHKYV